MELPEKTVHVGSFFEVEEAGIRYIRSEFQAAHGDDAPFVAYDKERHAFHFKSNDSETISLFLATLGSAIQLWTSRKTDDLTASPRLRPLPNTTLPTESSCLRTEDLRFPNNALIDFEYDSDDSTEKSSSAEGGNSLYWQPVCGDTSILSQDVAIAIADITECFIFRQADNKRVSLMHGNTASALEKLKRLEPLLESIHRHRDGSAARVDHNLLSLSSENPGNGVSFVPIATYLPHLKRVMVHSALEEQLENMLIPEERDWTNGLGPHKRPENLITDNLSRTAAFGPTDIWASFEMPAIGDPVNALPKPTQSAGSTSSSLKPVRETRNIQQSIFMPVVEQARLAQWSMNIDEHADPQIAAEKPVEPEPEQTVTEEPATKRLVAESDSDDDLDMQPRQKNLSTDEPMSRRLVSHTDSEDEAIDKLPAMTTGKVQDERPNLVNRGAKGKTVTEVRMSESQPLPNQAQLKVAEKSSTPVRPKGSMPKSTINERTISAADFYAGIPREDEDEGAQNQESSHSQQFLAPSLQQKTGRSKRELGFDGTTDDFENEYEQSDARTGHWSQLHVNSPTRPSKCREDLPTFQVGPQFDPTRYGLKDRIPFVKNSKVSQHQEDQRNDSQDEWTPTKTNNTKSIPHGITVQQNQDNTGVSSSPVATMPIATSHPRGQQRERRGLAARRQNKLGAERLVDIDEDDNHASPTLVRPPPGFDLRPSIRPYPATESNLLDTDLEQIQRPTIKPLNDQVASQTEDNLFSSGSSSTGRNSIFDYSPQTQISRPDIGYMRNNILDSLQSSVQAKKAQKMKTTSSPARERIAEDEMSSRKYYNTMNLQAGNAGKSKKKGNSTGVKREDSEAAARRTRAIEEVLGPVKPTAKAASSKPKEDTNPKLSKQAQKLARKNPTLAVLHSDTLQSASRKALLKNLSEHLKQMFDYAAVFPGTLNFEIQLGQMMVKQSSRIRLQHVYEPYRWSRLFDGPDSSAVALFSDILTSNGADMDRLLETKPNGTKCWEKKTPGRSKVMLEFRCQDQTGSDFLLACDEKGNHYVTKGVVEIGKIGIHCSGRIWDACAILNGTPRWEDIPQELEAAVKEFVGNLHIKSGPIMTVFHRLTAKSTLTVQDVVLRRISLHQGIAEDEKDLILKITETKTLYTRSHRKDKRLFKSFEIPDLRGMAQEHRVFYTASITHAKIAAGFEKNKDLEVGETRSADISIHQLLADEYLLPLINAAVGQVEQIDWMGLDNYGTIPYQIDLKKQREYEMANTLPPSAMPSLFAKPVHMPAGLSIAGPRSLAAPQTVMAGGHEQVGQPIYGVRMGEYAGLYRYPEGGFYRLGRGGAKIPLSEDDPQGIIEKDVTPNDSASQVGTSRTVKSEAGAGNKDEKFW